MNLRDIQELYFITDILNVASIMSEGILSHNEARRVHHCVNTGISGIF